MASRSFSLVLALVAMAGAEAFDIDGHRITFPVAAVYTPMRKGSAGYPELNLDLIPAYAERLAKVNVTGVLTAGTNGESLSLSVDERKRLAEAWARSGPEHGVRVYVHVGAESVADAVAMAAHAASLPGVSGVVCMTPVFFKPTVTTLHGFLATVAAAAPKLPFWYYHFPDTTGVLPGQIHKLVELVEQSGEIPTFMGIKFTDYNLFDFQLCTQVGGNRKYNMLYGRDESLTAALRVGADAPVSSTVQYSRTLRDVLAAVRLGDDRAAEAAQLKNAQLCSTFGAYDGDVNVQKDIMSMTGLEVGPSRLPKRDLTTSEFADLKKELTSQGLIDAPPQEQEVKI